MQYPLNGLGNVIYANPNASLEVSFKNWYGSQNQVGVFVVVLIQIFS